MDNYSTVDNPTRCSQRNADYEIHWIKITWHLYIWYSRQLASTTSQAQHFWNIVRHLLAGSPFEQSL